MKADQSTAAGGPSGGTAGLGRSGLGTSGGQRLPTPPRERKPALAALAVLLILGGALASAYLVMASGDRVSAIMIAQPVAAGQQIPESAMREVRIGDTGIDYLGWSEMEDVKRHYATVPLVEGTLLTNGMISRTNDAAAGRLVVGLALKPGQFPVGGVVEGKRVTVYAVGGEQSAIKPGTVLAADAIVVGVGGSGGGSVGGERLGTGVTTVDVAVPPDEAAGVASAAAAGAVAIALIPPETKVEDGAGGASPLPTTSPPGGEGLPDVPESPGGTQPSGGAGGTGTGGTGTGGTGTGGAGTGGAGGAGTGGSGGAGGTGVGGN